MPVILYDGYDKYVESVRVSNQEINGNDFSYMYIQAGGTAYNTTVSNDGYVYVSNGGVADSTTINKYGNLIVSSGGTALNINWTPFTGSLEIKDGAYVTFTSSYSGIYYGSDNTLQSSALTMSEENVSGGATAYIMSGGSADKFTVADSAYIHVASGGKAVNNIVADGGTMKIYNGGIAENLSVTGGTLTISSGASATNVNWTPCVGKINVVDGGFISYTQNYSGVYYRIGDKLSNAASVNSINLASGDEMIVMSGGVANNTVVNKNAELTVSSGGTAYVDFNPWMGKVYSKSGAQVTYSERDGKIYLASNNILISKYQNSATQTNLNAAHSAIIYEGGTLQDFSAENTNIRLYGGSVVNGNISGGIMYLSGGVIRNTTLSDGDISMTKGSASAITATSKASINILGGSATDITLQNYGDMSIKNAEASDIDIYSSAMLLVQNTGKVKNGNIYGGSALIWSGGHAEGFNIASQGQADGEISAGNGASISNITLNRGGKGNIFSGGSGSDIIISGGSLYVASGAVVHNIDWTPCEGNIDIHHEADVSFKKTYSGVYSGSNGQLLENTASISGKNVSGLYNSVYVMSDGIADNMNIADSGTVYIMDGGKNTNANINSGGYLYVSKGANAISNTVNSKGLLRVWSGGVAGNTTINKNGRVIATDGAVMSNTKIASGGSLYLSSGAVHRGTLDLSDGSYIAITNGAVINLDVSKRSSTDSYIINNINAVGSTATYTLTVSGSQNIGSYKLASGASAFSNSFTIQAGAQNIGSISINGDFVHHGDRSFKIVRSGSNLILNVTEHDIVPPNAPTYTVSNTELTKDDVIITVTFSDDSAKKQYSLNNGEWQTYTTPIVMTVNGTVSLRGIDESGNISDIVTFEVTNIDKEPPTLEISGNTTEWTNKDIILEATASDGKVEYFDGENWHEGNTFTATKNGTYKFRATDLAGNVTEKEIIIDKIDKEPPTLEVSGNTNEWTNKDVVLSAIVSDGKVEYFDGENWHEGDTFTAVQNGTYIFRVTDCAGNVTEKEIIVDKIDKEPPTLEVSGNTNEWTNKDVVLSATFSDGKIEYFDGENWHEGDTFTATQNGTFKFRVTDRAGNVTEKEIIVDKIDKEPPTLDISGNPTDWTNKNVVLTATVNEGTVEYFDGKEWVSGDTLTVTENGTYRFRVTDRAGNVTEKEVIVDKIDKTTPFFEVTGNPADWTNQNVILTAFADPDITIYYSYDEINWEKGSTVEVEENKTVYFKAVSQTGNTAVSAVTVDKIDKTAPELTITADTESACSAASIIVSVNEDAKIMYSTDNENWLEYKGQITTYVNGTYYFKAEDKAGNISTDSVTFENISSSEYQGLLGSADKVLWTENIYPASIVEFSTDDFASSIQIKTSANQIDLFGFSAENYKWRIKSEFSDSWTYGNDFAGKNPTEDPEIFSSESNGADDIFTASAKDVWGSYYFARNTATGETVSLCGKNKIIDIFEGSSDANALYLTDDANGDALFIDDIFSASFENLGRQQARFSNIDEIYAGDGDDIIDFTSNNFKFNGDLTIHGGKGDDIIWTAEGKNSFVFEADWGNDTIHQQGGSITLYFEGVDVVFDEEKQLYTDGTNTVKVSGTADITVITR